MADRVWDVIEAWSTVWDASVNVNTIRDPQQRLAWAIRVLPDRIRAALPLVDRLATADLFDYFGEGPPPDDFKGDVTEELLSVRTQVAQGLPVRPRWTIDANLSPVSPGRRDAIAHSWLLARGDETFEVVVYISRTAFQSDDGGLPSEVVAAKRTNGRSLVTTLLSLDEPPGEVMVSTAGIRWPVTD